MGIIQDSKCSAIIANAHVARVLAVLREEKAESDSKDNNTPVIDSGINYLALTKTTGCDSTDSKAIKIADFDQFLSECRCIVNLIADSLSRHYSKRVPIDRRPKKTTKDTLIRVSRFKLNQTNHRFSHLEVGSEYF